MSTGCQQTSATKAIPTTRRVAINDAEHMPHDYCTTPGGTLFSTTPGGFPPRRKASEESLVCSKIAHVNRSGVDGTRIIYDRKFLLECRSSPVTKTPPRGLPDIPGVTSPTSKDLINEKAHTGEPLNNNIITAPDNKSTGDDAQFEMDI